VSGQRASAVIATIILTTLLYGCASTTPEDFVEEPGVTVRVMLKSGESMSGTLIGMDDGMFVVDHSIPKSTYVTVVRSRGVDVVQVHGVPVGTAVEIRDVDILVRERIAFFEIDDISVVRHAYFGWGTGIAAALAFALVHVFEDL
jgi:small nuclear ribonucleoprotein (snRNP)-like protein